MFRSFRRNKKGNAALEFGILAPIFFALLMLIVDFAMFVATRTIVEDAVETGARAVRLGILSQADGPEAFREVICSRILFLDCDTFRFSVESPDGALDTDEYDPFTDDEGNSIIDAGGDFTVEKYDPGGAEDIVVVTIIYKHDFIFSYIGEIFGDDQLDDANSFLISSFLVFKNEPYPDGS